MIHFKIKYIHLFISRWLSEPLVTVWHNQKFGHFSCLCCLLRSIHIRFGSFCRPPTSAEMSCIWTVFRVNIVLTWSYTFLYLCIMFISYNLLIAIILWLCKFIFFALVINKYLSPGHVSHSHRVQLSILWGEGSDPSCEIIYPVLYILHLLINVFVYISSFLFIKTQKI